MSERDWVLTGGGSGEPNVPSVASAVQCNQQCLHMVYINTSLRSKAIAHQVLANHHLYLFKCFTNHFTDQCRKARDANMLWTRHLHGAQSRSDVDADC